jgi:tetratricopeptide (TPR) repeat protein
MRKENLDLKTFLEETHKKIIFGTGSKHLSKTVVDLLPQLKESKDFFFLALIILADWSWVSGDLETCNSYLIEASQHLSDSISPYYQFKYTASWLEYSQRTGQITEAIYWGHQGVNIAKKTADTDLLILSLANAGLVYKLSDDLEMAFKLLAEAIALTPKHENSKRNATNLATMGEILEASGEKQKATDYFLEALTINTALGDLNAQAINYSALSDCQLHIDINKAEEYANQGLDIARNANLSTNDLSLCLVAILAHKKCHTEADKLLATCRHTKIPFRFHEIAADVYIMRGDFIKARI